MDAEFYLSAESSGTQGRWRCFPYQIAIADWFSNDDIQVLTWRKAARVGYSKILVGSIGYNCSHRKRNQLVYQPVDSDAKDFCNDEIDTMIRDVPVVRCELKGDIEKQGKHNTAEKKKFHGCTLDIKGGKAGRNYRRMTKDVVYYDELDGFVNDVDGEGSPVSLGDTRITTSSYPKSIRGTTPKERSTSQIEASLRDADLIFARFVPCLSCGDLAPLTWARMKFDKNDFHSAGVVCEKCGYMHKYTQYPEMDKGGIWKTVILKKDSSIAIDEKGYWYDEKKGIFYDNEGQKIPTPYHIGVVLTGMYSYFKTWNKGVYEFIKARRELKRGDHTKMKTFVNIYLGESWEDTGERLVIEYDKRVEDYDINRIPEEVVFITAGADVQGGKDARIELEIVGWGIGEETWSLGYYVIPGNVEQTLIWDHVEKILTTKYERIDGVLLPISCAVIDSGYLAEKVFAYTGPREKRNVFASKGKAQSVGPICGKPTMQGDKIKALQIPVNTGDAKTIIYNRLEDIDQPGPGYCHFGLHCDQHYFDMLTSEEKKLTYKKGKPVVSWEVIKGRRNEGLDCRVYNLVAYYRANPNIEMLSKRIHAAKNAGTQVCYSGRRKRRVRSRGING